MSQQIRMWMITAENTPTEIPRTEISQERRLQNWLAADISMLDPDLLVIGREVSTAYGGKMDLLCVDSSGGLVVIELKKGRTPRDVVAQVLDYACWVRELSYENINSIYDEHQKALGHSASSLSAAFHQKFGDNLPALLNESHRSLIVAEEMDSSTERIVRYLSDLSVPVNVATVQHFKGKDNSEMLAQVYLIEPEVAADAAQAASRRTTYLSVRKRQALAEKNGVGNLYRKIKESASGRLSSNSIGQGNVALNARVEDRTLTVLVMHLTESGERAGLRFRLNATRLIKYFGLTEEQIKKGLPSDVEAMAASEWRGAGLEETENWIGFKGCFPDEAAVERFLGLLQLHTVGSDEEA